MGGVWMFKDGVTRLVENPLAEPMGGTNMTGVRRKVLVHIATNEAITSYDQLEHKLGEQGWSRYYAGDCNLRQYHRSDCSSDLISLPKSFAYIKTMHLYDIVVKIPLCIQRPRHVTRAWRRWLRYTDRVELVYKSFHYNRPLSVTGGWAIGDFSDKQQHSSNIIDSV